MRLRRLTVRAASPHCRQYLPRGLQHGALNAVPGSRKDTTGSALTQVQPGSTTA